jgi:hypothetical protein
MNSRKQLLEAACLRRPYENVDQRELLDRHIGDKQVNGKPAVRRPGPALPHEDQRHADAVSGQDKKIGPPDSPSGF